MSLATILQLFLLTDVFFVGVLVTIALQHARAHFRKPSTPGAPATTPPTPLTPPTLTPMMRERLTHEAQKHFEESVTTAVTELQHSLGSTATELDQLLRRLGGEIVGNELERYRVELAQLRQQAQADLSTIRSEVASHRTELEQQMNQELAAEKERLIQQIDTKLGDAVGSFLLDALQHNIDLGAQEQYLLSLLEEHKAEFRNEVDDEHTTA